MIFFFKADVHILSEGWLLVDILYLCSKLYSKRYTIYLILKTDIYILKFGFLWAGLFFPNNLFDIKKINQSMLTITLFDFI